MNTMFYNKKVITFYHETHYVRIESTLTCIRYNKYVMYVLNHFMFSKKKYNDFHMNN